MNLFLRLGAPATAIAAAAIFGALTTGIASAGEFCRQDVTGHMTSCGFASMEQCQAASSGSTLSVSPRLRKRQDLPEYAGMIAAN